MKKLELFLQINEGRAMEMALYEKEGQVLEYDNVVACNSYSFIAKLDDKRYQAISVDPINFEKTSVDLPESAISQQIIELINNAQSK